MDIFIFSTFWTVSEHSHETFLKMFENFVKKNSGMLACNVRGKDTVFQRFFFLIFEILYNLLYLSFLGTSEKYL